MKFNNTTYWIAVITLIIYSVYILSALGIVGLLLSLAGGLIAAAFFNDFELVTVAVVFTGLFYVIIARYMTSRPIVKCGNGKKEGFSDGTPKEITQIVDEMGQEKYGKDRKVTPISWTHLFEPTGVLSDNKVEGFFDVSQENNASTKEGAPSTSTAASTSVSTTPPAQTQELAKKVEEATTAPKPEDKKEKFSSNQKGLFKLGELPSEAAEGPHIDAGTTLMKAMSSLQPDQINAMTADTKSLLETQQNLMGMLKNMQPILQDGRKLLDSFSGIFGNEMGGKGFNLGGM